MKRIRIFSLFIVIMLVASAGSSGQNLLSRNVSLTVNRQRIDHVLEILSNRGDFYFSYNSAIIKKDSLVSFNASNKTVKEILGMIFNKTYEFTESGNYIISSDRGKNIFRQRLCIRRAVGRCDQ
jgi:hypothetical protein